jgi:hypothetical protein
VVMSNMSNDNAIDKSKKKKKMISCNIYCLAELPILHFLINFVWKCRV